MEREKLQEMIHRIMNQLGVTPILQKGEYSVNTVISHYGIVQIWGHRDGEHPLTIMTNQDEIIAVFEQQKVITTAYIPKCAIRFALEQKEGSTTIAFDGHVVMHLEEKGVPPKQVISVILKTLTLQEVSEEVLA